MPRQNSADQLEAIRQQQVELVKRIRDAEAKQREKAKAGAERRKLLVGGLVLDHMATEPDSPLAMAVRPLLASGLTRAADRALFPDLPPLRSAPKTE
jgi:hypothetical protein